MIVMAKNKNKEKDDEYVTLRLQCWKRVVVYTTGFVNVHVPRANRRRIRPALRNVSPIAQRLDESHCIEWRDDNNPLRCDHFLVEVKQLPDSDQAYRCRFNPETQEWEFVFDDGTASRAKEVTHDSN
jgi:hypothetical protein